MELDPRLERLELAGHVVVAADRYRLTGDRLAVTRTPRGVVVEGPGRVAFCPCPSPPVTLGFSSARLVAPSDLVVVNPTLRVGDVPVAWLPYFWLRSPRRVGVLPLKVAWLGEDGLLLGSGIHVPVGEKDQLDLRAAGYLRGGVDVRARLATGRTETSVRWDYLRESLFAVDSRGASSPVPGASVAWSVDALRGARSLTGPVSLEEAALRQDRLRSAVGTSDGTVTFGLSATADAARGGPVDSMGPVGPGLHAGVGAALGRTGAVDADVDVATLHESTGATTVVLHRGEARVDARAGAVVVGIQGRSRVALTVGEQSSGRAGAVGLSGQVSAPFVKRFGSSDAPLEHWVTPFAVGTIGAAEASGSTIAPPIAANGAFGVATPGVRTTLGERAGARFALTMSLQGGAIADESEAARGVVAAGGVAEARTFSFHEQSVYVASGPGTAVHVFGARLGAVSRVFVSARLFESVGDVPLLARFVSSGLGAGWDAPWSPWFGRPGTSMSGRVGIPWTRWLASAADSDYDVTQRTLLGTRGSLAYLHPCGCLRVSLWGGARLGRQGNGVDTFLTVDLARYD